MTTSDPGPPSQPTGMVPRVETRLDEFLGGDPALPIALLLVVGGADRGAIVAVETLPAVIGRSRDADLTIEDETVSRRHATLAGDREHLEIEDEGSSNGTTLNGNAIAGAITLHDGDLVGLGSATVLVKRIS
ncbi:FHA domain-containing protein [Actinospongicola halichondriae]|uniref:FHA domain-containing protein n=1 Tax=Actinospongicola halichondriae TaxID=3236844 RepID=UPI003D41A826